MLSEKWKNRKEECDFIVIGSGYGGAITAARIATAGLTPSPSIYLLEQGREWPVGKFPDTLDSVVSAVKSDLNPLGLYELLNYPDISVIKGSGLGGTSLVNANVAATPDPEVFDHPDWPRSITFDTLSPYFAKAKTVLGAGPDPRAWDFHKVHAMDRRARQIGERAFALDLTINFGPSPWYIDDYGSLRRPCLGCGDCITGCNHHSKNTLYMNYLPMARKAGAKIYTEKRVDWIEKRSDGGYRVHGTNMARNGGSRFKLSAANVILAAGSINSTEILMRSESKGGLALSPILGTRFSTNGDFFGLSYNGDYRTHIQGFGNHPHSPAAETPPGPAIVSGIHYNSGRPLKERIQVEDLSIARAYVEAAKRTFALIRGEDSDTGDEQEERRRIQRDMDIIDRYQPDGALNHSMMYLVMGLDDARGRMIFEKPWYRSRGQVRVVWDEAGRQPLFTRINEELRRHARAQGGSFISNPVWAFLEARHLITAHPLGGCPIGEDYSQGVVDEFGRVFAEDGSVHEGLFVVDGAVIPTSIGVNPFLTISALAERIAERKIEAMQGREYPKPKVSVSPPVFDPIEVVNWEEPALERLFLRLPAQEIDILVNSGQHTIDTDRKTIRNDICWKGFFPKDHILNAMSSAIFTGFQKKFERQDGEIRGVTSDTDNRIQARNTVEEIHVEEREDDLEPGRYILLRYTEAPWQGFYDLIKIINDDLLVGRVYLGKYPNGLRLFTFPMTRTYGFQNMTVDDHRELYGRSGPPSAEDLDGAWRMDLISNANQASGLAYLRFDPKPDGRLECRYQLMGLLEGLLIPEFFGRHFQLSDFTPFHDEIRRLDADYMLGKYVADVPGGLAACDPHASLGLLHQENGRFGFYYTLTRVAKKEYPTNTLLRPFLNVQLPDGLGMIFDEEMEGWFLAGEAQPGTGGPDRPLDAVDCSFRLRMTVKDLNEFIDSWEHEARVEGTISFGQFEEKVEVTYPLDQQRSSFQYLRVNPATGEAQLCYRLGFGTGAEGRFTLEGNKFMQADAGSGRGLEEILEDYTTLYGQVYREEGEQRKQTGTVFLKFRTFEDLAAVGNLTGFLRSFRVTGTDDPLLQIQAKLRFLAFTGQFMVREYDPLSPELPLPN